MTPEFGPLDIITLAAVDNRMPALLVLCRAPANDGWLAVEDHTGIIYNLFDSIAYLYKLVTLRTQGDLNSRKAQARLLARATWFHHPDRIETVSAPPVVWS